MAEPIGSGRRFRRLEAKLANNPKIHNPAGLAAKIGRQKYGPKRFAALAQHGKREAEKKRAAGSPPPPVRRTRV